MGFALPNGAGIYLAKTYEAEVAVCGKKTGKPTGS
ncbi:hypothetical protein CH53_3647 [Yersinia intermedia]|nr:hypothetical protein CH53_3647 [Yersinia intermedia]